MNQWKKNKKSKIDSTSFGSILIKWYSDHIRKEKVDFKNGHQNTGKNKNQWKKKPITNFKNLYRKTEYLVEKT